VTVTVNYPARENRRLCLLTWATKVALRWAGREAEWHLRSRALWPPATRSLQFADATSLRVVNLHTVRRVSHCMQELAK
jgi:hypothetical protein